MLAGVDGFPPGIDTGHRVGSFNGVIAINTAFCRCGTLEPISVVESAIAKQRPQFPAIHVLQAGGKILVHLRIALFHGQQHRGLVFRRKILEFELPARANADAGEFAANVGGVRRRRDKLQRRIEILEKIRLDARGRSRFEIDRRCGGRWRLLQKGR